MFLDRPHHCRAPRHEGVKRLNAPSKQNIFIHGVCESIEHNVVERIPNQQFGITIQIQVKCGVHLYYKVTLAVSLRKGLHPKHRVFKEVPRSELLENKRKLLKLRAGVEFYR